MLRQPISNAGRTATLVVAASDATALNKGAADYLCDGTADDVQIQAAIDALPAVGGKVVLSEGTFTIAAAISIDSRLVLQGMGRYNTKIIQVASATGVDLIKNGSAPAAVVYEVQIRGMTLDGNKANCTVGKGIAGSGFQNLSLTDVRIESTVEEALYASGASPQAKNWFLYDVVLASSGKVGATKDNLYWANGAGLAAFGFYSLTATKSGVQLSSSNEITLNSYWIDQNTSYGLSITSCGQSSFSDGYLAANTDNGIYVSGTCNNLRLHDNISYQNVAAGLYLSGTINDSLIHHNQLIDNTGWGYRAPGVTFARTLIANNDAQNNTAGNWSTTEFGTGAIYRGNINYNPIGVLGPPTVPATTVAYTNAYGVDCTVYITGGTVTAIAVGGSATGFTSGAFRVPAGQTVTITYSSVPTWTWFGD